MLITRAREPRGPKRLPATILRAMDDELEQAWRVALQHADPAPWRVLADRLVEAGDPRGEWMQLELDAEAGTLKGLARGRRQQLVEALRVPLTPPGVSEKGLVFERAVPVACRTRARAAQAPGDPRWRSVRELTYEVEHPRPTVDEWAATALCGGALWCLETLRGVHAETLAALGRAPPLPRLRTLWMHTLRDVGHPPQPPLDWDEAWTSALAAQPTVREVHYQHTNLRRELAARLAAVNRPPVTEVHVDVHLSEVLDLQLWRDAVSPRFALFAAFDAFGPRFEVQLRGDALVLHAPPGDFARASRLLRQDWPRDRAMPPVVPAG